MLFRQALIVAAIALVARVRRFARRANPWRQLSLQRRLLRGLVDETANMSYRLRVLEARFDDAEALALLERGLALLAEDETSDPLDVGGREDEATGPLSTVGERGEA